MARSLTVKHEESPSALFATFLILCGCFLLLGAVLGASSEPDPADAVQGAAVQASPASVSVPAAGH